MTYRLCRPAAVIILVLGSVSLTGSGRRLEARNVTFSEDVAPIVFNKCATCHRPGEAAPFSLQSYADVKRRGALISAAVTSGLMPPWKASPGDYAFRGDRRLSAPEIDVIKQWVSAGMPEGDPAKLPQMPKFTQGWQLGEPDLVVSMKEAFEVPAEGPDVYRNFVLPLNLTEDRWVRAVDFRPSARAVVHHSLFFLDATGAARRQDAEDSTPGFAGAMGGFAGRGNLAGLLGIGGGRGGGRNGAGRADRREAADQDVDVMRAIAGLGGWALGAQARMMPDGLAYFVPKGSDLVLSTHFHPSGKAEKETSVVGIYFAKAAPTQAFSGVQLPPIFGVLEGINIPAGEKEYTIRDSWVLPVDVKAFNAGAHAHYLAKHMTLTATFPDRTTRTLLEIRDWNFAWQEQYQFKEFVPLPKGTRLDVTITYDNSADNPRNPNRPPARVTWGEQSTDEMGAMGLQVVTDRPEDLRVLQRAFADHVREAAMARPGLRQMMMRGFRP
jgi:hypothetical protein